MSLIRQDGQSLPGERHDVLGLHLHPGRRNPPLAGHDVDVDVGPLCAAEFTGPHERQRGQLQRGARNGVALVGVEVAKELRHLGGLRHCGSG